MSRDGHDYDMGFHAPWCGKCGAEDDARQADEQQFEDDQWAAVQAQLAEIRTATEALVRGANLRDVTSTVYALADELETMAQQTFAWPENRYFEP